MQNPIFAILGERGAGKTLLARGLAEMYSARDGIKVITNFKTKGNALIENKPFSWIKNNLESLYDCVIFLDEAHVGIDSYEFLHTSVKALTDFITQIRKRNVTLFVITQRFDTLARRLRIQTNYFIQVEETDIPGRPFVTIYDASQPAGHDFVKELDYNGIPMFNKYDTNEIIFDDTEADDTKEEVKNPTKKKSSK